MPDQIRIAVIGLRFGAEFAAVYRDHPDVAGVGICDANADLMARIGDQLGIGDRFPSLDDVLALGRFDAVHIATPVWLHVEQSVAALNAGLHCACAVPVAMDLEGIRRVVDAQRASGRSYMMMETAVYTREFLLAQEMHARGELGNLTFLRGIYFQDLEGGYQRYWREVPPMHYATHAVAPVLALAGTRAAKTACFGSGRLRADLQPAGVHTFPLQTAIFQLARVDIAAEVTRSWFQTAHPYTEAFCAYGDLAGFDWRVEHEAPTLFTLDPLPPGAWGRPVTARRLDVPDYAHRLPEPVRRYTTEQGHGGSHPHLVHEFIRSIVEGRPPAIDMVKAADWTAPGICAHDSALRGGELVEVPSYEV